MTARVVKRIEKNLLDAQLKMIHVTIKPRSINQMRELYQTA